MFLSRLTVGIGLGCCLSAAFAEHPDGGAAELGPVTVTGERDALSHSPAPEQSSPGGVDRIGIERYEAGYALTLQDMLRQSPGVYAQPRFAEEVRLSIRGSGLGRNVHLRGVDLVVDGIPINLADGSGDFQELDPLLITHADVYRGGNAMSQGAATLGGAILFETPTARTMPSPLRLRLDGGSNGTARLHAQAGKVAGAADGWLGLTTLRSDGWRAQSQTETLRLSGNSGWRWNERQETRLFATYNAIDAELPGTLSREQALSSARSAPQANRDGDFARDIRSLRLALRHRVELAGGRLDVGATWFDKRLFHPVPVVVDQNGSFYGVFVNFRHDFHIAGLAARAAVGATWREGDNDARLFTNPGGGVRGFPISDVRERADQLTAYFEQRLWLLPQLQLIAGGQWLEASRDFDDRGEGGGSDSIRFQRFSPRVGLLYAPRQGLQIFANATRSAEPPSFIELNQIRGQTAQFVPLSLQRAKTLELGSRGSLGRLRWDVTLYRSWVDGELLAFTEAANVPAQTFNADRTIHQGVEALLALQLLPGLEAQATWSFNGFRFEDDPVFGDNRLAGIPRHFGRVSLRASHGPWYLEPAVDLASRAEVDFANSTQAPGYAVAGLSGGWRRGGLMLFAELRNLLDHRYLSSFSTVTDLRSDDTPQNIFYPGEGRRFFVGLRHDI